MGMILFIVGVMMIVGGLSFGLPLHWRNAADPEQGLAMGAALGVMLPTGLIGLGLCIFGLVKGKSAPVPTLASRPSTGVRRESHPTSQISLKLAIMSTRKQ